MDKDKILVDRILDGDVDSFETLVINYRDRILNFLFRMTLSKEDAEDIAQEVFVKVYNNLYRYNSRWSFSTWIYTIAINICKSTCNKRNKIVTVDYHDVLREFPRSLVDNPEYAMVVKENSEEIIKIIDSLKFDQKTALILKHIQGFSYEEIGKMLKITPGNARIKVMRAKQILIREFFEKTGGEAK